MKKLHVMIAAVLFASGFACVTKAWANACDGENQFGKVCGNYAIQCQTQNCVLVQGGVCADGTAYNHISQTQFLLGSCQVSLPNVC